MSNKVFILLPVHNRINETTNFVKCLNNQTYQNWHLLLIDDGSIDGTSEMAAKNIDNNKLTVIKGSGNWWWGGSLHQGYKWLKNNHIINDELVLIMNDDTIFDDQFIETGVNLITKNPKSLILAYTYSFQTKELIEKGIHIDWKELKFIKTESVEDINCLQTMGLIYYVKDFYKIGGFHPKLIPHYLSDYEFTIRSHQKGYKLLTDEKFKLFLNEKTTNNKHEEMPKTLKDYLKKQYSKRSSGNPFSWLWFVLLRSPIRWKTLNTARIIKNSISDILYYPKQQIKKIIKTKNKRK